MFLSDCVPLSLTGQGWGQQGVLFVYQGAGQRTGQVRSVCVSGVFNGWAADQDCLRFTGSRWEAILSIPSGRYAYVFVINGDQLRPDPRALLQEDDGFGGVNSILVVP